MTSEAGTAPGAGSWTERAWAIRDRLIGSAGFRRWAAAFPLTRPMARRSARRLFDLVAGFVYSQILLSCVRLKVFDLLAAGPLSPAQLAQCLHLNDGAVERLVRGAVALDLLATRRDGRIGLGELGAAMVGNDAVTAMVEHHALLYADLQDPVALLRGEKRDTRLSRYWPYAADRASAGVEAAPAADYSRLMSASQPLIADELLDAYSLKGHARLLDVGGGEGRFAIAAARRYPALAVEVFDLPAVAERARAHFAAQGLADRARAHGGNFFTEALPGGADVVSLVRVLFDHDDDSVLRILRGVRQAMSDNGVLLVAEPMAGAAGARPMGDAYFGFYLLAMGKGRSRSAAELRALLRDAGFGRVRIARTKMPLQTGLLIARP